MTENILEEMTNRYNQMTRSGKLLANYIFANTEKAQYLSITSLAENCGVSEATITRFCRTLGLSGYNDLKLALAKTAHPNELGEFSDQPQGIITTDTIGSIGKKLRDAFFVSVNETLEQMEPVTFGRAVMYLHRARQVFCFGQGGNTVLAQEAWARFSQVTNKFIHIADSHMQIMATSLADAQDVILFFSYSGSTKDAEELLTLAKKRHIPIILLTHFRNSMAAQLADVILLCGYNESPLQSGCIAAKIGQLLLLECLYYSYCNQDPDAIKEARASTSEAISKKLL